jgi:hypothetical protein
MLDEVTICCGLDHDIFFAQHAGRAVADAAGHALVRARRAHGQRPRAASAIG